MRLWSKEWRAYSNDQSVRNLGRKHLHSKYFAWLSGLPKWGEGRNCASGKALNNKTNSARAQVKAALERISLSALENADIDATRPHVSTPRHSTAAVVCPRHGQRETEEER